MKYNKEFHHHKVTNSGLFYILFVTSFIGVCMMVGSILFEESPIEVTDVIDGNFQPTQSLIEKMKQTPGVEVPEEWLKADIRHEKSEKNLPLQKPVEPGPETVPSPPMPPVKHQESENTVPSKPKESESKKKLPPGVKAKSESLKLLSPSGPIHTFKVPQSVLLGLSDQKKPLVEKKPLPVKVTPSIEVKAAKEVVKLSEITANEKASNSPEVDLPQVKTTAIVNPAPTVGKSEASKTRVSKKDETEQRAVEQPATPPVEESGVIQAQVEKPMPLKDAKLKPGQVKELRVWVTYNEEQFRIYRKIVRRFEDENGVKVRLSRIPFHGQGEKFMYACNSRQAPDIARMEIGIIAKFAAGKALLALDDLPGMKELKKDLLPAALAAGQVKLPGKALRTYAVPDEFTTLALFYNKKHFRAARLNPENPPKTWKEFLDVSRKLLVTNSQGRVERWPFAMKTTLWWSMPFLFSFNGHILNDDTLACRLTEKGALDALKFQIELTRSNLEAGAFRNGALHPDAGFKNGKYSMILSGPWNLENFRNSNVEYGIALIPGNEELGIRSATNVGGNANVVFKTTRYPELSMKFLKYLASVEIQKELFEELGAIPINTRLARSGYQFNNPDFEVFIRQSEFAGPRPKIPGYDKIETIVNSEVETAFSGDRSPLEAYQNACKLIDEQLVSGLKKHENTSGN